MGSPHHGQRVGLVLLEEVHLGVGADHAGRALARRLQAHDQLEQRRLARAWSGLGSGSGSGLGLGFVLWISPGQG